MAVAFLYVLYCCEMSRTPMRVLTKFAAIDLCSIFWALALGLAGTGIVAFLLLLILLIQNFAGTVKREIDIYVKYCGGDVILQKFPNGSSYKSYILLRLLCG